LWCWRAALRQLPAQTQGLPRRNALEISIALEFLLQPVPQANNAHVGALSGPTCLRSDFLIRMRKFIKKMEFMMAL
jgi:hypothetical protein